MLAAVPVLSVQSRHFEYQILVSYTIVMPHVCLKVLQHYPTWKIIISILRVGVTDSAVKTSDTRIIDDMVAVRFRFAFAEFVTPCVEMKLTKANEKKILVRIEGAASCEFGEEIIDKLVVCSTEWVECQLPIIGHYSSDHVDGLDTLSYLIEVGITVSKFPQCPQIIDKLSKDTDFQLRAFNGTVAVHKALLEAYSDVFKAKFSGEWKGNAEGSLDIHHVTIQTLQHLRDYMYLGVLPDEGLPWLVVVASRYSMDKLKEDSNKKLFDSLTSLTCENVGIVDELFKVALQNIQHLTELSGHIMFLKFKDMGLDQEYEHLINKQKAFPAPYLLAQN